MDDDLSLTWTTNVQDEAYICTLTHEPAVPKSLRYYHVMKQSSLVELGGICLKFRVVPMKYNENSPKDDSLACSSLPVTALSPTLG